MNSFIENFTQKCIQKPRLIFLIDGLGAFVSLASMLLLYKFLPTHFTLSFEIRRTLLSLIMTLILFDVFLYIKRNPKHLNIIIFLNLFYVVKTVSIFITEYEHITTVENAYYSIEILVLIAVIALENHIFRAYKNQSAG